MVRRDNQSKTNFSLNINISKSQGEKIYYFKI